MSAKAKPKPKSKGRPKKKDAISPTIAGMLEDVYELRDKLRAGVPLEQIVKVTWVRAPIKPSEYGPDELRALRAKLGATQADLAEFLGSSLHTVRCWEQGQRPVPPIARRFLDEIQAYPQLWIDRMSPPTP